MACAGNGAGRHRSPASRGKWINPFLAGFGFENLCQFGAILWPFVPVALGVEITIIALTSGFIGLIIGYFLAGFLLPGVAVTLSGLYGVEIENGLPLRPVWVLSGLGMSLLGAGIASFYAFLTLWRLPILQAPSTQARGQLVLRNFNLWALAGTGLLASGGLSLILIAGLAGGFIFLGCLMLGTALLLPYCLWHILRLGQSLTTRPLAHWLWADARAQLPGLSLALMALMLGSCPGVGRVPGGDASRSGYRCTARVPMAGA